MLQKDMNKENQEINDKAYELYEKNGSKDGADSSDWLEAERQTGPGKEVETATQIDIYQRGRHRLISKENLHLDMAGGTNHITHNEI